ncbi:TonB-dependent receptor [Emcibacter sp. SYSU 3D8]|uniref:TonB-dependent receptor n=1 Tax=Emcibacter sp. SYSU 3D8 TaxID=3133969 RepID=UPI0031FF3737
MALSVFGGMIAGAPAKAVAVTDTPAVRTPITSIESVTTTARKREEPLQEAPVAVTAISGQELALKYTTQLNEMAFPAPSVNMARLGSFSNAVTIFIRGIGNSDNDSTTDPPVAIFIDGVYIPQPENSSIDLFDVESIEVLRGPQGTLFGRNTTAGAVQVRTRRPSGEFGTRGRLTIGQYGRLDVRAAVDLPIVQDKLDAKISILSANSDGYYTNTNTNAESTGDLGRESNFAVRPIIRFRPNDDLTLTLIGEYTRTKSDPTPGVAAPRSNQILCSAWGYCPPDRPLNGKFTKDDYLVTTSLAHNGEIDNTTWGITGELVWDVGPGIVTWVSNYRKTESFIFLDIDSTEAPMFKTSRDSPHKQTSTELRFASSAWDSFDFVAGVYGFYQEFFLHRDTTQRITPASAVSHIVGDTWQNHKAFSAFAEGNYHFNDRLTLTAGGRWSWERKAFYQEPFAPFPNTGARITPDPKAWSNFGPKAGLSYQISDDALAYFTYSRGFKSGGWNGRGGTPTTLGPFDPEVVDGFEFGMKSDWFDNRLRANFALFLNKYKNLQRTVIRFLPGAANPQETVTSNAASANIKGAELELTAIPLPGLQLTANASYLDASYGAYCADLNGPSFFASAPTSNCGGTVNNVTMPGSMGPGNYLVDEDFSNTPFQRAPKFQISLGATYEFDVGNTGSIVLNANFTHISNMNVSTSGSDRGWRGKVNLVDGSITYRDIEGRYSVSLFGKNLTNEIYLNNITEVAALFDTYGISEPRRWGIELSWDL